jgi:hypothetical protein
VVSRLAVEHVDTVIPAASEGLEEPGDGRTSMAGFQEPVEGLVGCLPLRIGEVVFRVRIHGLKVIADIEE